MKKILMMAVATSAFVVAGCGQKADEPTVGASTSAEASGESSAAPSGDASGSADAGGATAVATDGETNGGGPHP